MLIQVTQEDIDRGKRHDSTSCPVALACLRSVNKNWANVFESILNWNLIPESVYDFIRKFDRKEPVEPFEFELPELKQ